MQDPGYKMHGVFYSPRRTQSTRSFSILSATSANSAVKFAFFLLISQLLFADAAIERKQIREEIKPGETLLISNPTGDIRVRRGAPGVFEAFAVIQNLDPATQPPEMKTEKQPGKVVLKIEAPQEKQQKPDRADLTIYVPDDVELICETESGLIEMKGLHAKVSAQSVSGDITIRSTNGSVQTINDHGSTLIEFQSGVTKEVQEIASKTGDITIYVDEKINSTLNVETSGEISTDFSIQIQHDGSKEPDKRGTAILGKGGNEISIKSKRGKIRLLRVLRSFSTS